MQLLCDKANLGADSVSPGRPKAKDNFEVVGASEAGYVEVVIRFMSSLWFSSRVMCMCDKLASKAVQACLLVLSVIASSSIALRPLKYVAPQEATRMSKKTSWPFAQQGKGCLGRSVLQHVIHDPQA